MSTLAFWYVAKNWEVNAMVEKCRTLKSFFVIQSNFPCKTSPEICFNVLKQQKKFREGFYTTVTAQDGKDISIIQNYLVNLKQIPFIITEMLILM